MELKKVKEEFLDFAQSECLGNSVLYYQLSRQIAEDKDLLRIASMTRPGQPIANLLLASVHYLILKDSRCELAEYYPSITKRQVKEIPFPLFKQFCMAHENGLTKLFSTKIVQTNVISRCAYLMPIFSEIIARENKPTTLIDIGTSAGLTLNFDKYEYWYNGEKHYGQSNVIVNCQMIDSGPPHILKISQPLRKIGVDQHIVDLTDPEEILWMKALIWPDQLERFTVMDNALQLDERKKINFIQTNTILDIENVILQIAEDQNLIIYATHVLYQFPQKQKERFYRMLKRVGRKRDYYFLAVEGTKELLDRNESSETVIELTQSKDGQTVRTYIAETNGHGNWIRLKNPLTIA